MAQSAAASSQALTGDIAAAVPVLSSPRATVIRPWRDADRDSPATATGRALLMTAWARLLEGAIECIDVQFRGGGVLADVIALRLNGPIAEAATTRDTWSYAFALDEVAMVRGVDFGRFRD